MRRDNVEVLMMSKRFLLIIVFLGSAFTAVDSDTTAAVADSVTVGSATDRESSSDSTPGSDAPAAEATSSAGQLLETTANSEAATTVNADSAETTEPLQEASTTTRLFDPDARDDGAGSNEKDTTQASDAAGTTVAGALSTIATREVADGQSTENSIVPPKEEPSTAPEKVTTDSGIASSRMPSQGDSTGQAGTEKVSDSGVQDATSQAEVAEDATKVPPPKADEDKSNTGSENEGAHDKQSKDDGTTPARQNIWQAHRGLFITIAIMIAVCIVIGTLCLICLKCRGKSSSDKQRIKVEEGVPGPLDASSPIPDEEMVKDEAPMQEVENPAVTPNGGGQHISKDEEDNGWVVPLDELTKPEKEKPETENTKL